MTDTRVTPDGHVLVVGTGQAGFQLAASLRDGGHIGPITLFGEEPELPYQRPPLSKAYLKDEPDQASVLLRSEGFYASRDITVRPQTRVRALDRELREVELENGNRLNYDHLVLATGTRARPLDVPGSGLRGVTSLRTLADANVLRSHLAQPRDVVIVGGGFIGMEIAAVCAAQGHRVTVVEGLDRPMARVVSPAVSEHVVSVHAEHGVRILLGQSTTELHGREGRVRSVELASGEKIEADLVLVGIGALANSELAAVAGMDICPVTGGIVVDERLQTADPHISAIGDCATYPSVHATRPVRLESVQNAVDHARHVARRLTAGSDGGYCTVPWFWTNQYDLKIQIAGLGGLDDECVVVGDRAGGRFSVLRFDHDRLVAVESVNRAPDHMAARKLLAGDRRPTPAQARCADFDLKGYHASG